MVNVVLVWFLMFCILLERMIDPVWLELFSNEKVRLKEVLVGTEKDGKA